MVKRAALVVDAIAEVSMKTSTPPRNLGRSASFLAMPPPKARPVHDPHEALSSLGLDLLSNTAACLPVVTPILSSHGDPEPVPAMNLERACRSPHLQEEKDFSCMTADQCANIVDSIFGEGLDESVFHHHSEEPPAKRARAF